MMRARIASWGLAGVAGLIGVAGANRAEADAVYSVTRVANLLGGAESQVFGINGAGQVIGTTMISDGGGIDGIRISSPHPFVTVGGQTTSLGVDGGRAMAIDPSGRVVGMSGGATPGGFSYNAGAAIQAPGAQPMAINASGTTVGSLNSRPYIQPAGGAAIPIVTQGLDGRATGINDGGRVILSLFAPGDPGHERAYIMNNQWIRDLGTLGGSTASANAINASGRVVGTSATTAPTASDPTGGSHAFVWINGTMHDLGTLGGTTSDARAINASGQVVGSSSLAGGDPWSTTHAFITSGGSLTDLNSLVSPDLGYTLTSATGINDRGQIAVNGVDVNGLLAAFVLTPSLGAPAPVPEPATYTLLVLGGLAVHLAGRARRRGGRGLDSRDRPL